MNSNVPPIEDVKVAMRVLESFGNFLNARVEQTHPIADAMNLSYAFLNSTVKHQARIDS